MIVGSFLKYLVGGRWRQNSSEGCERWGQNSSLGCERWGKTLPKAVSVGAKLLFRL